MNRLQFRNVLICVTAIAFILICAILIKTRANGHSKQQVRLRNLRSQANAGVFGQTLESRVFHVGTNFYERLSLLTYLDAKTERLQTNTALKAFYELAKTDPKTEHNAIVLKAVRKFLTDSGVDLSTNNPGNAGKAFVWNDRKGLLLVKAGKDELEALDSAIQSLNHEKAGRAVRTPPLLNALSPRTIPQP